MKTLELTPDLYYCGVADPGLRTFDIVMHTEFGTTYNSYLLRAGDKTVLFETAKECFCGEYLSELRTLTDPAKIDAIVVSHTEPDHVGSLASLLDVNPNIEVIGTVGAIGFLKLILNRDFRSHAVKDGEVIEIGNKTLQFYVLPNLHWPDTMYTYIEELEALVTCDSFGAHYCCEGILRSTVPDEADYQKALKYYFDNILGPFKRPFLQTALDRISPLSLRWILTGHGPVHDTGISELVEQYRAWVTPESRNKKQVVVAYASAYGYTKELATRICEGLRSFPEVEVELYDMEKSDAETVAQRIVEADGFLLGSPTLLGDPVEPVFGLTLHLHPPMMKGKYAAAFGSYGWSGEAVPTLTDRLCHLKCKVTEGFRVRFRPSEEESAAAQQFGTNFAKQIIEQA
ncbi:FprA family A-type flavoprotein [Pygmaiobacter massiliensis]|uniref:FprA family A-type flavoprotein n=1 Tax=Pygmaiobacter massiliensis TaxID=1917873 RepID=UPI000C7B9BD2|nr:FprA family A-type flavoprotein [Pygmaiobacter massiliensis]